MDVVRFTPVTDAATIGIVAGLAEKIWREHYTPIIGETQVTYMLDKFQSARAIAGQLERGFLYYLARDAEDREIGYLGVAPRGDALSLSKIYLLAGCRGRGYGRRMMEFVERLAAERGCARIVLTVNKRNTGSIKAYESMGFVNRGPVLQDIGNGFIMDDFRMEKQLGR